LSVALIAYILDRLFGEFKFIRHPIEIIGAYITWFESFFYKDSIYRGIILLLHVVVLFGLLALIVESISHFLVLAFFSSMFLAHTMLYQSVLDVVNSTEPRDKLAMLVSRDTKELSESEVNKAAIETYSENLSDGVIAPLFYLLFFGFTGVVIYKAINTLDSMVGYKTERYEKFGKASAVVDDIVNFIPSRITALLISILFFSRKSLNFFKYAKKHDSPNAGYPISAMALYLDLSLGGNTKYFGKIKNKAYFGNGRKEIAKEDVLKALSFRNRLDIFIIGLLFLGSIYEF